MDCNFEGMFSFVVDVFLAFVILSKSLTVWIIQFLPSVEYINFVVYSSKIWNMPILLFFFFLFGCLSYWVIYFKLIAIGIFCAWHISTLACGWSGLSFYYICCGKFTGCIFSNSKSLCFLFIKIKKNLSFLFKEK